jgi:hypothetical protein
MEEKKAKKTIPFSLWTNGLASLRMWGFAQKLQGAAYLTSV